MNDASRTAETKRRQGLHSRAHVWATKHQKDAPSGWNKDNRDGYWWGLFEGYKAGIQAERRKR